MPVSKKFRKYNYSEKGQARRQRYEGEHPGRNAERVAVGYYNDRYHKLQDEAGCHKSISTFYTGYRLLQSLTDAEVIEI